MKRVLIFLVAIVVGLGIGEIYLRGKFKDPEHYYLLPPLYKGTYMPTPAGTPGIVGGPAEFRTNRWGLRGDEIPADGHPVVYVMGGSTSIDVWLREAWPQVLEHLLRREPGLARATVINISKWGLSTHHNVMHFQEVVPYLPKKPDVVVLLAGVNDMQRALKTSYPGTITPEFERRVAYQYVAPEGDAWYGKSGLYRLFRRLQEVYGKLQTGPLLGVNGDVFLPLRKCRQSVEDKDLVEEVPSLAAALDEYRRNLRSIIGYARRYGAEVVFATQPTLWRKDMPENARKLLLAGGLAPFHEWFSCRAVRYYSPAAQERALGRFNEVMREVCQSDHVACLDLERIVTKEAAYFYDDMHFTEAGAEAAATAVARQVIDVLRQRPPRLPTKS
ncbi:MAG: SGNH/GDSL hydrolase family protein [Nitrospirae bacterium]|nr:MAG: SGNH/GDSL hydrolase family protein [Nitrospirota bacterium]